MVIAVISVAEKPLDPICNPKTEAELSDVSGANIDGLKPPVVVESRLSAMPKASKPVKPAKGFDGRSASRLEFRRRINILPKPVKAFAGNVFSLFLCSDNVCNPV